MRSIICSWCKDANSRWKEAHGEISSHILKNRLSTTQMHIRRHNMEIDVVKKRIWKEGYVVLNKPRVVSHEKDQLLRPGLCAKKDGKAMILDAHVQKMHKRSKNMHHTATASGDISVAMTCK